MPCEIEWHGRNVHWKFNGIVDGEEQINIFSDLYGHADFDNTRGQIRNYSGASNGGVTLQDIKRIAAYDRAAAKTNPRMKIALVIGSKNQNNTALISFYDAELHTSPWQVDFFENVNDALEWVA